MIFLLPDLDSDLVPGKAAAGFSLGDSFFEISDKVGQVEWYGPDVHVRDILLGNLGWVGVSRKVGFGDKHILSYRYMNEVVSLYFEESKRLYRIAVGNGYRGGFHGVRPGDSISKLAKFFEIEFNSDDDDFLLISGGEDLLGISFVTDYRASLEDAPEQTIESISIHDWSLR
jgi:hypothetical protein